MKPSLILLLSAFLFGAVAQPESQLILEESRVPAYTLPDPLVTFYGSRIEDPAAWRNMRRPEILRLFEENIYGRTPRNKIELRFETLESDASALKGKATRKQVRVHFGPEPSPTMDLLIYVPNKRDGPAPAFLGLNSYGNQTVLDDEAILLSERWMMENDDIGVVKHRATERSRGVREGRWQIRRLISRGYAVVTAYYGDLDPDKPEADFTDGVHPLFYIIGQQRPLKDEWGAIGAWAWGLSRALDYIETDDDMDPGRVAVFGHSRLGKAALWAGAQDERFAMVISNESGCGGAALYRRRFGERLQSQTAAKRFWFCEDYQQYSKHEERLPVDQHMLISLVAPRPVYVASAEDDLSSDPRGEFLAAKHADPVYRLLGTDGLPADKMPKVNRPVSGRIGYHVRKGGHDLSHYDWKRFLDFADKHLVPPRHAFIDGGAFRGGAIKKFWASKLYPDHPWEVFAFECNPVLAPDLRKLPVPRLTVVDKAVWIHDKGMNFYIAVNPESSTLLKHKRTGQLSKVPVRVGSVDFGEWLRGKFRKGDTVYVNLDIEGAEYDVLEKLLKDGGIEFVDKIYVEFHNTKVDVPKTKDSELIFRMEARGVNVVGKGYGEGGHPDWRPRPTKKRSQ
ncbi:FkbM family methyltransferase [Elusimicrobiota bacterium]